MKKQILSAVSAFLLSGSLLAQIPANGLVGAYFMNGNANNSASSSYNGVVSANTDLVADRNGKENAAYRLYGAQNISFGDVLELNTASQFSISVWLKPDTIFTGSSRLEVFAKRGDDGVGAIGFAGIASRVYNGRDLYAYMSDDANPLFYSPGIILELGKPDWFHYVVTYNAGKIECYKDGVLEGSTTGLPATTPSSMAGKNLYFGSADNTWNSTSTDAFKGDMDDILIYGRALDSSEVRAIYNAPDSISSDTSTVGLRDIKAISNLVVFPNPAQSNLTIQMDMTEEVTVEIYSIEGKLMQQQFAEHVSAIQCSIETLPVGFYWVKITSEQGTVLKKINKS